MHLVDPYHLASLNRTLLLLGCVDPFPLPIGSVMRLKESSEQSSYLKEADSRGALELVYAALDVLGKTAWAVNRKVLEVALEVRTTGIFSQRFLLGDVA